MDEFKLIQRYFSDPGTAGHGAKQAAVLGIGDDCALLSHSSKTHLAVSVDTLVESVHFPQGAPADLLAQRALCVSISDLAAMGAKPLYFTLALTLPESNEAWLAVFSRGLAAVAKRFDCSLVGGDTTRGPLAMSLQVFGECPQGGALLRSGAAVGDSIYVSGPLGDSAAALALMQGRLGLPEAGHDLRQYLEGRYYCPEPQLALGMALRGVASAAIDISDGLMADLGHICKASGVSAQLHGEALPTTAALHNYADKKTILSWALSGGDDYQLCFTVPQHKKNLLDERVQALSTSVHCVGEMVPLQDAPVQLLGAEQPALEGYKHFE